MSLRGAIRPLELAQKITEQSGSGGDMSADSFQDLRIYDATIAFRRTEAGVEASADREAYEAGHIPGAHFVDHQADLSDSDSPYNFTLLPPDRLEGALRSLGINNTSTVVVYSTQHLMWATRMWWILRSCGLEDVYVLDGGFDAWKQAGLEVSTQPESDPQGNLDIQFSPGRWADQEEVLAAIEGGSVCTLNALPESSHKGTGKMHYARPGHIEGSVNVPYEDFMKDGFLRSGDDLRSKLERVDAFARSRAVTYCGGGIAATLAAFVLDNLGHPDVGVYDGSLSEWSADPNLPMATEG